MAYCQTCHRDFTANSHICTSGAHMMCIHAPRFKVGDKFTSLVDGSTWEVRTGPFDNDCYVGRVVGGVRTGLFHISAMQSPDTVVCTPDKTRCASWHKNDMVPGAWRFCPSCGGKLMKE